MWGKDGPDQAFHRLIDILHLFLTALTACLMSSYPRLVSLLLLTSSVGSFLSPHETNEG